MFDTGPTAVSVGTGRFLPITPRTIKGGEGYRPKADNAARVGAGKIKNAGRHSESAFRCTAKYPLRRRSRHKRMAPEPVRAYYAARSEERAEVKAAWEESAAKRRELLKQFDCDRLEKEWEARFDELRACGDRIFETPAKTIEGMAVKLRVGKVLGLDDFADDNDALASIAKDVERMAGGVS
jgi:hypothetical protein